MARAGGNCGVWGSLVLLGLCGCSVVRTAAPNPVINLRTETQTNTSITLRWEVPDGTDPQNLTYWIQWLRDGGSNNTQITTGTRVTVDRLAPASSYEFSVWAEKDGVSGSPQTLIATTASNKVSNLRVEGQNTTAISLSWDPPENSSSQDLTYWAQCIGYDGKNETRHTKDTRVTVDGLDPGTSYECSVRVEKDGVYSTWETKNTTTAPNPVRNLRVEGQNTTSISLSWDPPENSSSQDLTYWAQCIRYDGQNETRHTKDTRVSVDGLDPGTSYECSVRVEKDGVYSTWETKNTTTAVIAGAIVGILLLFILVGLLIVFLKRRRKKQQPKEVPKDLVFRFPGDILAKDFADHVRENEKDSNCGFAEEYQQLALEGQGQSQMTALALENVSKNRYRNVLPCEFLVSAPSSGSHGVSQNTPFL